MGKNARRRAAARQARRHSALEDSVAVTTITAANRQARRWDPKHVEMATRMLETAARHRRRARVKPRPQRGQRPWQVAQRAERKARQLARRAAA